MINKYNNKILENLKAYIGKEVNADELICCFPDNGYNVIVDKVNGIISNYDGYGRCQLYNLYYDHEEATVFNIYIAETDGYEGTLVDIV